MLSLCVAAVVNHRDWLRKTLPPSHLLFQTPLFADEKLMQRFADIVTFDAPPESSSHIVATGIPPYVLQFASLDRIESKLERGLAVIREEMVGMKDNLVNLVVESANRVIEATTTVPPVANDANGNTVAAPTVETWVTQLTNIVKTQVDNCLATALERMSIDVDTGAQSVNGGGEVDRDSAVTSPDVTTDVAESHKKITVYLVDGKLSPLPPGYDLPNPTAMLAWRTWWRGIHASGVPALRLLREKTHLQRDHQIAYAPFKSVCTRLESYLKGRGLLFTVDERAPTEIEVAVMFSNCKSVLEQLHHEGVRTEPAGSGSIRTFQLTIATLVKYLRVKTLAEMEQMGKDAMSVPTQSTHEGSMDSVSVVGTDDPVVATPDSLETLRREKADAGKRKKTL
jgi:hypothetical protein